MKTKVDFVFNVGTIDNKSMNIELNYDSKTDRLTELSSGIFTHTIFIDFPTKCFFLLSGKGEFDTLVDEDGNILQDKFIHLVDIKIDNLSIDQHYLPRFVEFTTEKNETILSSYWGFNGTCLIDFSPTPFQWVASTNRS